MTFPFVANAPLAVHATPPIIWLYWLVVRFYAENRNKFLPITNVIQYATKLKFVTDLLSGKTSPSVTVHFPLCAFVLEIRKEGWGYEMI